MSSGRDARRRNRNIGTAWQGHGSNNRLVIPDSVHATGLFWERLTRYKAVTRAVGGKGVTFIVERTRADSCHSCTVDDIERVLRHVPASAIALINLVILRQPKRKEQILDDAWGRAAFFAEVGRYRGPAIILRPSPPPNLCAGPSPSALNAGMSWRDSARTGTRSRPRGIITWSG